MSFKDFNMDMNEYNQQIKELEDNKPKEETKKEYRRIWIEIRIQIIYKGRRCHGKRISSGKDKYS